MDIVGSFGPGSFGASVLLLPPALVQFLDILLQPLRNDVWRSMPAPRPTLCLLFFLPGASQQGIPFPIFLLLVVTLGIYFIWLYNNTLGSLIITFLAHFSFNISRGFPVGTLGLLPPMVLYVAAGSTLVLTVIGIIW